LRKNSEEGDNNDKVEIVEQSYSDSLLSEWHPKDYLLNYSFAEAKYSSGFLRSKPQNWFPSIATQWLTLAHSLGIELSVIDCVPSLKPLDKIAHLFCGSLDGNLIGVGISDDLVKIISETELGFDSKIIDIYIYEYLCRRLFSSITIAWIGKNVNSRAVFLGLPPEGSKKFLEKHPYGVQLVVKLGDQTGSVWLALSYEMVDEIDQLYRKQIKSVANVPSGKITIDCEIASLFIQEDQVFDYTKSGASVDLEIPLSDEVLIKINQKPIAIGRICTVDKFFAVEIVSKKVKPIIPTENHIEVNVRFPAIIIDSAKYAELLQLKSIIVSDNIASDHVTLTIDKEEIATASLKIYQGRLAVAVY
jgi:hypothetical protein